MRFQVYFEMQPIPEVDDMFDDAWDGVINEFEVDEYTSPDLLIAQVDSAIEQIAREVELDPAPIPIFDDYRGNNIYVHFGRQQFWIPKTDWIRLYGEIEQEDFKWKRMEWRDIRAAVVERDLVNIYDRTGRKHERSQIIDIYPTGCQFFDKHGTQLDLPAQMVVKMELVK